MVIYKKTIEAFFLNNRKLHESKVEYCLQANNLAGNNACWSIEVYGERVTAPLFPWPKAQWVTCKQDNGEGRSKV